MDDEVIADHALRPRPRRAGVVNGTRLGDWIKARRDVEGLSQRALADRAGISRSYLCDIERGRGTRPSVTSLDNLSHALGVDRLELLRVAGILEPAREPEEVQRGRRLLATFRGLSVQGQDALDRYARYLLFEEQRWTQQRMDQLIPDGEDHVSRMQDGPTLFDALEP